jgi:hypothetical protein
MIEKAIFYSWQSDLKHDFNWKLIETSLIDSIKALNAENKILKYSLDQATRGLPGSPDIVDSIFRKIEKSSIFVADITPITYIEEKSFPNPNVLIELGYAVNILGWGNVICICNVAHGKIETLPFDIKQRRITTYSLDDKKQKEKQTQKLTDIFKVAFPLIQENQATYDKVTELFKIQLDHILLAISNHFNILFKIKDSLLGIDVFYDVIYELSKGFVKTHAKIEIKETEIFLAIKIKELSELTKHPLLILNKRIDQITSVISLIKSLELLQVNILSSRFYDLSTEKGIKVELKEVEILNMLLSDIAKNINDITDVWGEHLLIDPSRIEL